jgi:Haem-binding domain
MLFVSAAAVVAIQLYPTQRDNPAVEADLEASAEVKAILRRSCYDCHSNETHWPWYAYVAPVSWLVAGDVRDGRKQLNFSQWGHYSAKKRRTKADAIVEQVTEGDMPLAQYLRIHSDAKLSSAEIDVLKKWADGDP